MRIEPVIGTDLRTTGRIEPVVSHIQSQIPFLEIEIDHTTNFNDVLKQIEDHITPFIFEARGSSILIENEGQKSLFITGLNFMWVFQEDKKAWHDSGVFNG